MKQRSARSGAAGNRGNLRTAMWNAGYGGHLKARIRPAIAVLGIWAGRSLLGGAWHAGARTSGGRGRCHRRRPRLAHMDQTVGEFFGFAFHMSQEDARGRWMPSPLLYASGAVALGRRGGRASRGRARGRGRWARCGKTTSRWQRQDFGHEVSCSARNWTRLPGDSTVWRLPSTMDLSRTSRRGSWRNCRSTGHARLFLRRWNACCASRIWRKKFVPGGGDIIETSQSAAPATNFSLPGPAAHERRDSTGRQESIHHVTGSRPKFFSCPAGLRNPFLGSRPRAPEAALGPVWTRRGFDTVKRRCGCRAPASGKSPAAGRYLCCCTTAMRRAAAAASR